MTEPRESLPLSWLDKLAIGAISVILAAGLLGFLLILALLMSGCAGTLPNAAPLPAPPPLRYVRVTVRDLQGNGLPLASGSFAPDEAQAVACEHLDAQIPERLTCAFAPTTDHGRLHLEAPGFQPYESEELDVRVSVDLPDVPLFPIVPPFVPLPRLMARGQFFGLETGERFTAIETSDFNLLGRYLNGEEIAPILQQRQELGFNLLRVWTRYSLSQYGIGRLVFAEHPDLYDRIPAFLQLAARHQLYVEFTAYTGREDFAPDHWARLCAAVQGSTNAILELVNENDQSGNHIDVAPFAPCPGILSSHGSNGSQAIPVEPFWAYATFHTNGASEEARKMGHNAWELSSGPVLTNETSRAPDNQNSETEVHDGAAGCTLLNAGCAFHSVSGKASQWFDQREQQLAAAFVAGARSVPLWCQDGPYKHGAAEIQEEEAGNYLRVYQRGTDPACRVRIRR